MFHFHPEHVPASPAGRGIGSNGASAREELGNVANHQRQARGSSILQDAARSGRPPAIPGGPIHRATTVLLAEIPGQLGLPSGHTNSEELEAAHSFAQSLPAHANVLQRRRVSWKEPGQAAETSTPVVEHHLAGDLHLHSPTFSPIPSGLLSARGTGLSDSFHRPSPPVAGQGSGMPPHRSVNFKDAQERRGSGATHVSRFHHLTAFLHREKDKDGGEGDGDAPKQAPSMANSDMQFEAETEEDTKNPPLWKTRWFWCRFMPGVLTAILLTIAIIMVIFYRSLTAVYFEVWRWAFLFAGFTPIYWLSRIMIHGLVVLVEYAFFTSKAIYYTYGVRKPLARFVRAVLVIPLFTGCFAGRENDSTAVHKVYVNIARVLGCISLFFFANVLKALAAKLTATSFHQESHFKKMQEALQKEYYIMALSQPRSEQKVDELLGNVRRESTQEEVNMGDFGQAPEQHEPASEAEEPLRKWRNGGSIPREFQGRSTSSFINRVAVAVKKRSMKHLMSGKAGGKPEDKTEQGTASEQRRLSNDELEDSPYMPDGRQLSDVEEAPHEERASMEDADPDSGDEKRPAAYTNPALSPRSFWERKGAFDPQSSRRSLVGAGGLERNTSQRSNILRPSFDSQPASRAVSFNARLPPPINTLHQHGPVKQNSLLSQWTAREPSLKGSVPQRASMRSRRGDDRTSAHAKTPASLRSNLRMRRQRTLFRTTGFKVGEGSEKTRDIQAVQQMAAVAPPRKQAEMNGEVVAKLHLVEKHIRKNKLQVTFADQLGAAKHNEGEVNSKNEAKKLAFYLFWNIKPYFDRNYVLPEDLEYFLPAHKAAKAFDLLDVDSDGRVTLHDIRDAVLNVYSERKHLAFQLKDTKTVVSKLERIFGVIIHLLFVILYLVIFDVDVNKVWITFSSIILAFSFVFSKSIGDMYAAVIFLFVVHPFDVGDALMIGSSMTGSALNQLVWVEEIALVTCVLRRWDGARLWWPNNLLSANPLINLSRSNNKWEDLEVYVDISTPAEVWDVLRKAVEEYTADHPESFSGQCAIFCFGASDPLKLLLGVFFEYSFNGVDQGRLNLARHGLFMCVRQVLNEQNVMYSMPSFKTGGGMAMPPGMRSGHASPNVNGQQDVHEPYVGAAPPSMGVQQAVGRASQAGWLPGQRGDSQVPGMAALVPDAIRQQF